MQSRKKPELLSPAGSIESVYAAVNHGCDAIYLGGKEFSARQYAGNFSQEELEQVCDYCHLRGVKVYVTVNTVYKDSELPRFLSFVEVLYQMGIDALIMQDMGAAMAVRKAFPLFALHASTQMTANSVEDVLFLQENGFQKVVLSRELSLKEIEKIIKNTEVAIETFVHGALCVSYSGQCIMSSMLGGRSGNRGRCAQTCRLPFALYTGNEKVKEGHLLSTKDIQTISILPELMQAGIHSLKIEGRMKSPEYIGGVTKIYRKYIDLYFEKPDAYQVDSEDMKTLLQLFNRGGFSESYYHAHSGLDMMSIERPKTWGLKVGIVDSYNERAKRVVVRTRQALVPGDGIEIWTQQEPHVGSNISRQSKAGEVISFPIEGKINKNDVVYRTHDKVLSDVLKAAWEKDTRKQEIYGMFTAVIGKPMSLKLWDQDGNVAYTTGDIVEKANKQALDLEKIRQQLKKMGATPFWMRTVEITADDMIFISISALNELRRKATESLSQTIIKKSKRAVETAETAETAETTETMQLSKEEDIPAPIMREKKITVSVRTMEQFTAATQCGGIDVLYFEMNSELEKNLEHCIQACKNAKIRIFAAMPRIYRDYMKPYYEGFIQAVGKSAIDGFLIRSGGEFEIIKQMGKQVAVDYSLNAFNQETVNFWLEKGASLVCLSPEMNIGEINSAANAACEMVAFGHLPLMVTHQCPIGAYDGEKTNAMYCTKCGSANDYSLKDRKGIKFPLLTDCKQCICEILNAKPLYTLKFFDEVIETVTGYIRLSFTIEDAFTVEKVVSAYLESVNHKGDNALSKLLTQEMSFKGSTKGHYFRGVE